jgi:hypothetical protein
MLQLEIQDMLARRAYVREMFGIQRTSRRLKLAQAILNLNFLSLNNRSTAAGIMANLKQTNLSANNQRAIRILKEYILLKPIEKSNYEFITGYL